MATTTFHDYNGNGTNTDFNYSFPTYSQAEVIVEVNNVIVDNWTITGGWAASGTKEIKFDNTTGTLNTDVCESSGAPKTGTNNVRIYRDTNVDSQKHTYQAGSSVKAGDLNTAYTHLLRAVQEEQNQTVTTSDIKTGAVTSAKIEDGTIVNADVNAAAAIAGTKISPDFGSQNIATTGTVDGRDVSTDGTKLDGIEASATADQTNAEIRAAVEAASDSNVFTDADHSKLNAIEASATADQTNAEIRAAVEAATDSNVFTDADHTKLNAIDADATDDQTAAEIRTLVESATDSNVFTDDDHTKLNAIEASADVTDATNVDAAGAVMNTDTSTASMDFVVDEDNFSSDSATKVPTQQSTKAYIAATSQPLDADLTTLSGMQAATASILASGTDLTSTIAELNLLDGKSIITSVSGSSTDVQIPTGKAVNDQIVALIQDLGGFVPIANIDSFPEANPDPNNDAGTIVSIADAVGLVVNASGVATNADTITSDTTVTINGIDSTLRGTTIGAGKGMLVQTTSTLNTYDYHRLIVDEGGVAAAQTLVTDFNQRYQVTADSTAPTNQPDGTALAEGDLWFDGGNNKMKVYNGSQYDQVTSIGDYKLLTIVPENASSGTPDYTNDTFDLRDDTGVANITSPGQLIVSVNGVIQKPNSGTSQPAEGFALEDSHTIVFGAAPGSGASVFITLIGSATTINTPGNNSVTAATIQSGAVETAKIADQAVDLSKLPHGDGTSDGKFLRSNNGADPTWVAVSTTDATKMPLAGGTFTGDVTWDNGTNTGKDMIWDESDDTLKFNDDVQISLGSDRDVRLYHTGSHGYINVVTGDLNIRTNSTEPAIVCTANGSVAAYHDNAKKFETSATGATVTGTLATTAVTGDGSALTGITTRTQPFRNLITNGAMQINQREATTGLTDFNVVTGAMYTLDRWQGVGDSSFDWDSARIKQVSDSPDEFSNSLRVDIGNTETPGAGQNGLVLTRIEAQDLQHLAYGTSSAKTCTLSFWVYSAKTGTYCVQIQQEDASKYLLYEYSISSADTWEKKTITFSGNTADAITNDNGNGLEIDFHLACHSDDHASATTSWASTGVSGNKYLATSNQVNLWDHADNDWYLTGVQLEVGSTATDFEHRSYGDELRRCQRYFYLHANGSESAAGSGGSGLAPICNYHLFNANNCWGVIQFPIRMRTSPSIYKVESGDTWQMVGNDGLDEATTVTTNRTSTTAASVYFSGGINMNQGEAGHARTYTSTARLGFQAEI